MARGHARTGTRGCAARARPDGAAAMAATGKYGSGGKRPRSKGESEGIGRGAHPSARGRGWEVGRAREATNLTTNGDGRGGEDGSIHTYGAAPVEWMHGDDGVDDEEVPGRPPGRRGGQWPRGRRRRVDDSSNTRFRGEARVQEGNFWARVRSRGLGVDLIQPEEPRDGRQRDIHSMDGLRALPAPWPPCSVQVVGEKPTGGLGLL